MARSVVFLSNDYLDPVFLRLVANHVNQAVAGNVHEVLVIDLAKVDILFPTFVVADNDRFPDRFAG